jgi:guanosine-3',5'-bis(diphosphate) 3'-pyrophosphohydrolase
MNDTQRVLKAMQFAAERHAAHRRKGADKEPYINHPIEVARLVSMAEPEVEVVMAAILHDTIEDAGVSWDELATYFGSCVADLVGEVTDDKTLSWQERKRLQEVNAHKKSPGAQLIKLADKISNMRSIQNSPPVDWTDKRKAEYFHWAGRVVGGLSAPHPVLMAEFEKVAAAGFAPSSD